MKHDEALGVLKDMGYDLLDAGSSSTMKNTRSRRGGGKSCAALICAAWSSLRGGLGPDARRHPRDKPSTAISHAPGGLCGWKQTGASSPLPSRRYLGHPPDVRGARLYDFKHVYNIIGKRLVRAPKARRIYFPPARGRRALRDARVRIHDGRRYAAVRHAVAGQPMRGQLGVEVEPYEMLEMVRALDTLGADKIAEGVLKYVKTQIRKSPCDEAIIGAGVITRLPSAKKITERGWEAIISF